MPICCNNVIALPTLWLTGKIRYVAFYCLWQLDELWLEVSKCLCSNCLFFIKAENYTWALGKYSSYCFYVRAVHIDKCSPPKYCESSSLFVFHSFYHCKAKTDEDQSIQHNKKLLEKVISGNRMHFLAFQQSRGIR